MKLALSFALALLAAPVLAQDEKEAEAVLKQVLAPLVKEHKGVLKELVKPATATLKETKAAVASGASAPGDGIEILAEVATSLDIDLTFLTSFYLLFGFAEAVDAVLFDLGLELPPGALVGTGGTLDKSLAKVDKQHRSALSKGRKGTLAVLKALAKQGQPAALRTPDTLLPATAPGIFFDPGGGKGGEGVGPTFGLPVLQLSALVGSSDADVAGDGSLQIAGFTSLAPQDVILSGQGPEGSSFGPLVVEPDTDGTFNEAVPNLPEGNWRVQASQTGALASEYIGIPGAPDPGTDPSDPKDVAKGVKSAWKQLVKQHGKDVKLQAKSLGERLKNSLEDIGEGVDPLVELEDVYFALETFTGFVDEATNDVNGVGGVASFAFGSALDSLAQLVAEQLVGHGLANDKSSLKVDKALLKATTKGLKSARGFAKSLAKSTDWRLAVDIEPVLFQRVAPVKGPELDALPVPLRIEILMGASEQGVPNDGILWMQLTGDDALGPTIELTLFGPEGFELIDSVSAPDAEDGVDVRFPDFGPGNLPEGNYLVVLTQGETSVSAAIAVPGGG